jgi:nucleoside-diphosphate-sugar epimerase
MSLETSRKQQLVVTTSDPSSPVEYLASCSRAARSRRVYGTRMLMQSDVTEPLNVGSAHLVTINELVSIVEEIAGLRLRRRYKLEAPQGVRGRNSDNALIKQRLGWEPAISLQDGLEKTYAWIYDEMTARYSRAGQPVLTIAGA